MKFMAAIYEQRVTATTAALLCLHAGMRLSSVGALVNLVTEKSGGVWAGIYVYSKHSFDALAHIRRALVSSLWDGFGFGGHTFCAAVAGWPSKIYACTSFKGSYRLLIAV